MAQRKTTWPFFSLEAAVAGAVAVAVAVSLWKPFSLRSTSSAAFHFFHPTILKNGQLVPIGANWCQISPDGWKQDTRCATIWQQFSHERGERGCPTHTPESYSWGTILPRPVSGASMAVCPFYQQDTPARTQCVFPPSSGRTTATPCGAVWEPRRCQFVGALCPKKFEECSANFLLRPVLPPPWQPTACPCRFLGGKYRKDVSFRTALRLTGSMLHSA